MILVAKKAVKIYSTAIIFLMVSLFSLNLTYAINYKYAGVLPFISDNGNLYATLIKKSAINGIDVYGGFSGKIDNQDNNKPQNTAARVFSSKANIKSTEVLNLIDKQCYVTHCQLKSLNNEYVLFALLIKSETIQNLKELLKFVEISNLEKAIEYANSKNQFDNIFVVTQDGSLIRLSKELIEELVSNVRSYRNESIFKLLLQEAA